MLEKVADKSTGILELKEETALLRYESECLLQKIDDFDQTSRLINLRIFQLKENPLENHS
nr:unnamed protein product [Callosobruchus analis]